MKKFVGNQFETKSQERYSRSNEQEPQEFWNSFSLIPRVMKKRKKEEKEQKEVCLDVSDQLSLSDLLKIFGFQSQRRDIQLSVVIWEIVVSFLFDSYLCIFPLINKSFCGMVKRLSHILPKNYALKETEIVYQAFLIRPKTYDIEQLFSRLTGLNVLSHHVKHFLCLQSLKILEIKFWKDREMCFDEVKKLLQQNQNSLVELNLNDPPSTLSALFCNLRMFKVQTFSLPHWRSDPGIRGHDFCNLIDTFPNLTSLELGGRIAQLDKEDFSSLALRPLLTHLTLDAWLSSLVLLNFLKSKLIFTLKSFTLKRMTPECLKSFSLLGSRSSIQKISVVTFSNEPSDYLFFYYFQKHNIIPTVRHLDFNYTRSKQFWREDLEFQKLFRSFPNLLSLTISYVPQLINPKKHRLFERNEFSLNIRVETKTREEQEKQWNVFQYYVLRAIPEHKTCTFKKRGEFFVFELTSKTLIQSCGRLLRK